MKYIKKFEDIGLSDLLMVGGKNASLGQMISGLAQQGIVVPTGFAITAQAYWDYITANGLYEALQTAMADIGDGSDFKKLQAITRGVRESIESGTVPDDLAQEIVSSYRELSKIYGVADVDVAVRSSATAEDLPTASFAGQQETYLNISGESALLASYKKCLASLFTDRAIVYRIEKGFDHFKVALSVGVQKMIRSDLACSGVAFSLDTETGFKDVIMIDGSYGLGESIVQGLVIPDQYLVHKPTFEKGFPSIVKKQRGEKITKLIYTKDSTKPVTTVDVSKEDQSRYCLSDDEVLQLARMVLTIEHYYSKLRGSWCPMDIEWAKDGVDKKLYIIQARPETVQSQKKNGAVYETYSIKPGNKKEVVVTGLSIGQQIVSGPARVIVSPRDVDLVQKGEILVTEMTDPDWVPAMKKSAGIITERGGRTCHAAIVSRELNTPAVVGADNATQKIKTGQLLTIDCAQGKTGFVYEGVVPFEKTQTSLDQLPKLPIALMVNIADPDAALNLSFLPVDGVGLARLEFIISNTIQVHPMALVHPEKVLDAAVAQKIAQITNGYGDQKEFFVDTLARGVAMIAAGFYPRPVIVRMSDFKSNEYRNLLGGAYFEMVEENPMIGFRGASRYYNERYREGFALECAALKKARVEMGFDTIKIMIPFVRTVQEAEAVLKEMAVHGLHRGKDGLEVYMMCEIPSNVIAVDAFSNYFDGMSIGSNDLTQLTLGIDRDSEILASQFDERDPAVKQMIKMSIEGAKRNNIHSGICGQAPSDYPEIAQFVIDCGIDSLSLNADSVIPFLQKYKD